MAMNMEALKEACDYHRSGFADILIEEVGMLVIVTGVSHRRKEFLLARFTCDGQKVFAVHTFLDGGTMSMILERMHFPGIIVSI